MKHVLIIFLSLAASTFGQNYFGTPVEGRSNSKRESTFFTLIKQRDAAIQKAVAPINIRFLSEAEKLLAQAIQEGDLKFAETIKREIISAQSMELKLKIKGVFLDYKWKMGAGFYEFTIDGNFKMGPQVQAQYTIKDDGLISMYWSAFGGGTTTFILNEMKTQIQEKGGGNNLWVRSSRKNDK